MSKSLVETLLGALVVAVAIGFIIYAYTRSNVETVSGYTVSARFTRVDGLTDGSDVRLGGIKIGSVVDQTLDPKTFQAIVTVSIDPRYTLPIDSSAAVVSDGLLGGKYIAVEPGGEEDMIEPNGEIKFTQSSVNIEELMGRFMFTKADEK